VIGFDGEVSQFSFENGAKLGKIKGKFVVRRYGREETEKKSQKQCGMVEFIGTSFMDIGNQKQGFLSAMKVENQRILAFPPGGISNRTCDKQRLTVNKLCPFGGGETAGEVRTLPLSTDLVIHNRPPLSSSLCQRAPPLGVCVTVRIRRRESATQTGFADSHQESAPRVAKRKISTSENASIVTQLGRMNDRKLPTDVCRMGSED
jgi:hypothetical protein